MSQRSEAEDALARGTFRPDPPRRRVTVIQTEEFTWDVPEGVDIDSREELEEAWCDLGDQAEYYSHCVERTFELQDGG